MTLKVAVPDAVGVSFSVTFPAGDFTSVYTARAGIRTKEREKGRIAGGVPATQAASNVETANTVRGSSQIADIFR